MGKHMDNAFVRDFEREMRALERVGEAGRRMREVERENAAAIRYAEAALLVVVMERAERISIEQERREPLQQPPPPPSIAPEPLTPREKLAVALARQKAGPPRPPPVPEVSPKERVDFFVKNRAMCMLKYAYEGEPGYALLMEICRKTGVQADHLPPCREPRTEGDLKERMDRLERPDHDFDSDELMERKVDAVKELSSEWRSQLVGYGRTAKDHHRIRALIKKSEADSRARVDEIGALKERVKAAVDASHLISIIYSCDSL